MDKVEIRAVVKGSIAKVWDAYTSPVHIVNWNFAIPEWHCPEAKNDLRVGGEYFARMEARDGSLGFDFKAIYNEVISERTFTYVLADDRVISVEFMPQGDSVEVFISFDPEGQNPVDVQKAGWQAILDNFKRYVDEL